MTFFEKTLRQILQDIDATYIGNVAYIKKDGKVVKICINNAFSTDNYETLVIRTTDKNNSQMDCITLKFIDLIGMKPTNNPNFRNGVVPHIWKNGREIDWYVYHPTQEDFDVMHKAIEDYLFIWM